MTDESTCTKCMLYSAKEEAWHCFSNEEFQVLFPHNILQKVVSSSTMLLMPGAPLMLNYNYLLSSLIFFGNKFLFIIALLSVNF